MKNNSENTAAVYDLISKKNFNALSADEKKFVLGIMSEEEYTRLHKTHLDISTAEQNNIPLLKASESTHAKLLTEMARKKSTQKTGLLYYKIPAWQAAAAIVLLASAFLLFSQRSRNYDRQAITYITDTVKVVSTQIQKVFVHDTIFVTQKIKYPVATAKAPEKNNSAYIPALENVSVLNLDKMPQIQSSGNSMADDSLTGRFGFYTVN